MYQYMCYELLFHLWCHCDHVEAFFSYPEVGIKLFKIKIIWHLRTAKVFSFLLYYKVCFKDCSFTLMTLLKEEKLYKELNESLI